MAKVWQELRHYRHRDMLQQVLLRVFERDQLECRVIQSPAFLPLLTRWTELLVAGKVHGSAADPHDVPPEVQTQAKASGVPEVRWLVKRLLSRELLHRGPPHFPSTLLQRGPQYPFEPWDLNYLRTRTGNIRGTELNQKVELPQPPEGWTPPGPSRPRDLWAEGCLDDEDHSDFHKPPRS
uniref:Uncharacterized protein n=1 Tax=Alexandrium catenella TaxID=2925 RepID=A0A7S1MSZ0_ALECA|mmetsp:Transcript_33062/g.89506  ORF Transcript_33062/g.89506 Transcript_33062/m.89506 type:complete len:180 (+) Transcript_33062:94-633(+)